MDVPPNLLARHKGGWLDRKGAASTEAGLFPLAGTRDPPRYLMQANAGGTGNLGSIAHRAAQA
ncbi:hypothetical protein GCM10007939_24400 [Amylibacter marinus]|uniref:Uncharacterized protein n=1 Tax=Amylibacter marinus TaxID=1475483 RepID=A0ABQ5VY52_9RHOB|nr:hypothetical protein [Amylibacter marinus]GLQ36156.1 hypothetical protein GCM10007939_24400 [Amylibacter marinus]